MGRRKNEKLEFRFYELPGDSGALALLGDAWVGAYGQNDECLHFHNLFEIGYCHFGRGKLILGEEAPPGSTGWARWPSSSASTCP